MFLLIVTIFSHFIRFFHVEDLDDYDEEEDEEDKMAIDEAASEIPSDIDAEDEDDYETITITESPNEQRYDEKMDLNEEKQAMEKFKGL